MRRNGAQQTKRRPTPLATSTRYVHSPNRSHIGTIRPHGGNLRGVRVTALGEQRNHLLLPGARNPGWRPPAREVASVADAGISRQRNSARRNGSTTCAR